MALALLCVAQFVVVLDVTIVAVALPTIGADLGMDAGRLEWIIAAYGLAFGGFLMLGGRAGDLYGRRRLFVVGLALFSAASLGCGLATSGAVLIAARAAQGLGAAALAPAALAILTATVPAGPQRDRAVALWTAAAAAGGALGWVLGGVLTGALGWRSVFLVNVPVGALALALVRAVLDESRDPGAPRRLDVAGALALTLGLTALVHGLTARALVPLAFAAASLAAFAVLERRVRAPLIPPGSLRSAPLLSAGAVSAIVTAATTPPLFLCLLYVAHELHRGPLATGLMFAPVNLAVIAGSWLGPRLLARTTPARAMAVGLAAIAAGALALLGISGPASLLAPFVSMGLGIGVAATASTAAGTAASGDRLGLASGLLNAAAQLGTSLGLALLVGAAASDYRRGFVGAALLAGAGAAAMLVVTRRDSLRGCPAG
jgi:MFS family permease